MRVFILTIALLFSSHLLRAENSVSNPEENPVLDLHPSAQDIFAQQSPQAQDLPKWSLETSLTFPAARIYMLKASVRVSEKSEWGFGPAFQNWNNLDKSPRGQANAYTLLLSYRYYFWRSFNAELELWPAYNHFKSHVDNFTYKGFELWVEYKAGYKLALSPNIYINLQPGFAHGLWMQNIWPGLKADTTRDLVKNSFVFVPQILLGWTF
ncbi:MAG: hypothetical protein ACK4VN_11840 [Bacteroidales bacterium]